MQPPLFIFTHGFMGMDEVNLLGFTVRYFRGVKALMDSLSVPAMFARVPRASSVKTRAGHLAAIVENSGAKHCVLVGHSMGGLDCRFVAGRLDRARRVKTVVSLATPHRGSSLADWMLGGSGPLPLIGQRYMRPALEDLTAEGSERFNREIPDRPDVRYLSYAASRPADEMPLWLRSFTRTLEDKEGPNDGQVSLASAKWGEFRGAVRADHFELIGWNGGLPKASICRPFPHLSLFDRIVREVC
ncbi:MAG: alpha/beta fold hydrolase [Rhodospirillales bacterium]